jgi:hypothetical protein
MAFVNWRSVNAAFCGLMWAVALVLAIVVLIHALPSAGVAHHASHFLR